MSKSIATATLSGLLLSSLISLAAAQQAPPTPPTPHVATAPQAPAAAAAPAPKLVPVEAIQDVDLAEIAITSAASLVRKVPPNDAFALPDLPGREVQVALAGGAPGQHAAGRTRGEVE